MRMFMLRPDNYSEEQAVFREHENKIIDYCHTHIMGNWILSFELWGETEETAQPTIILTYEGTKAYNWKDPDIGLPFVCIEDVFLGAMAKPNETLVANPLEEEPEEPLVEKKTCCLIC